MISDVRFQLDKAGLVSTLKSIMIGPRLETAVLKIKGEHLEGEVAVSENSVIIGARIAGAETTGIQALRQLLAITEGTVHLDDTTSVGFANNLKIDIRKLIGEESSANEAEKSQVPAVSNTPENKKVETRAPAKPSTPVKNELGTPSVRMTTKTPTPAENRKITFNKRLPDSVKDAFRNKRLARESDTSGGQNTTPGSEIASPSALDLPGNVEKSVLPENLRAPVPETNPRSPEPEVTEGYSQADLDAIGTGGFSKGALDAIGSSGYSKSELDAIETSAGSSKSSLDPSSEIAEEPVGEIAEELDVHESAEEPVGEVYELDVQQSAEEPIGEIVAYEQDVQESAEEPVGEMAEEQDAQESAEEPVGEIVAYEQDVQESAEEPVGEIVACEQDAQESAEEPVGEIVAYELDAQESAEEPVGEMAEELDAQESAEEPVGEMAYELDAHESAEEPVGEIVDEAPAPEPKQSASLAGEAKPLMARLLQKAKIKANEIKDARGVANQATMPENDDENETQTEPDFVPPSFAPTVAGLISPTFDPAALQEPESVAPSFAPTVPLGADFVSPSFDSTVPQAADFVPSFAPTVPLGADFVSPSFDSTVPQAADFAPSFDPSVSAASREPDLVSRSFEPIGAEEPDLVSPYSHAPGAGDEHSADGPAHDLESPSSAVADPKYLKSIRSMIDSAIQANATRLTNASADSKEKRKEKPTETATLRTLPAIDEPEAVRKEKARNASILRFILQHKVIILSVLCVTLLALTGMNLWRAHEKSDLAEQIENSLDKNELPAAQKLIEAGLKSHPRLAQFHFLKGRLLAKQGKAQQALSEYLIATDPGRDGEPYNLHYVSYRAKSYLALGETEKAMEDLNRILEFPSQDSKSYANRAVAEMQTAKFTQAVADSKKAVSLDPTNASYHATLASAYALSKKYKDAIGEWNWIVAKNPGDASAYAGRANVEYSDKQTKAAFADLDKSIEIKPGGGTYFNRGLLYRLQNRPKDAIADFNSAVRLDPKNSDYLAARAQAYASSGDLKQAMGNYDAVAALQKNASKELLLERSSVELSVHKYRQAAEDLGKLVEQSPTNVTLRVSHAETCEKAEEFANARDDYTYLIGKDPKNPSYYVKRGWILSKLRHFDLADADFEKALTLNSKDAEAYLYRGMSDAERGEYELASIDFDHVLKMQPGNQLARQKSREIARLKTAPHVSVAPTPGLAPPTIVSSGDPEVDGYKLMMAGNLPAAIHNFAAAVKNNPNNAQARKYLAYALLQDGQTQSAIVQFKALAMLGPLTAADESKYADALQQSGDQEGAAQLFAKKLTATPGDLDTRMRLTRIYWNLGRRQKAQSLCQEGIRTSPNDSKALHDLLDSLQQSAEGKTKEEPGNNGNNGGTNNGVKPPTVKIDG